MIEEILTAIGVMGIILFILVLALLPFICTIVLGTYLATMFSLNGIVWWAFVILFYIIIIGIIGSIAK